MYNFIHRKLVKGGSSSCIIQPNNGNFVPLLVVEVSLSWCKEYSFLGSRPPHHPTPSHQGCLASWAQAEGEAAMRGASASAAVSLQLAS